MLKPHLTSVSFDKCAFTFSFYSKFQLNLCGLPNLTHFQCSECYHEDLISILETISSKLLISFNISRSMIKKRNRKKHMRFLMHQINLETLNVSDDQNTTLFPKLTGEILKLPQLKYLNLKYTVNVISFVETLNEITTPLN